jgi:hypothetical protein
VSTISTTITNGVTLGQAGYTSPLTITAKGFVSNSASGSAAVYAASTYANADIRNLGTIIDTGTGGNGIFFGDGGSVGNSGLIEGAFGVHGVGPSATVTNSGTILSTATGRQSNDVFATGVFLNLGGVVDNTAGLIQGYQGVYIYDGSSGTGTVTNAGTIVGSGTFTGLGVRITGGNNSGLNIVDNQSGGLITGGVLISAASNTAPTLTNNGTIVGDVLFESPGGSLDNTGLIKGPNPVDMLDSGFDATLTNSGTIVATNLSSDDVEFERGSVTNSASGQIVGGRFGIYFEGGGTNSGAVVNSGTVAPTATNGIGIELVSLSSAGLTNSGLIIGAGGVTFKSDSAASVSNSGTVDGTNTTEFAGVYLASGGSVTNTSGGLIEGHAAVYANNTAVSITNSGTMVGVGTFGDGIFLKAGGSVDNEAGLIVGPFNGVGIKNAAGTVLNAATIVGTGTNGNGVYLGAGGTIIDSGRIAGGDGTAVSFGGTGANFLEIANGYKLNGSVIGSGSVGASNTLQLLGTVGNAVTVNYSGLHLSNFQDVLFGSGGHATLDVSTSGTLPVTISGFIQSSDIIDLTSIGTNGTISSHTASEVTVTGSLGSVTLTLDGSDAANLTHASDGADGTDLSVACFRRGTLILAEKGEVPIEDLMIGDLVMTVSGEPQPIRWIGRRSYDGRFIAGNHDVLPICITAGALADGLPARDLWVSPGHAMLLDDLLVPAEYLLNGATIVQEERVEELEYLHIELDEHAILIAEGAASESYVDCDNRLMFANGAEYERQHPNDPRPRWAYCAPRLDWESPELVAIRGRLIEHAATLGHPLTLDPDLHLVTDGVAIAPVAIGGSCYRFEVPAGSSLLSLASRSVVPAEVDACSQDRRRLGVPVERISLYDADFLIEAAPGHAALRDGFHLDEDTHRWTDGLARLPAWWVHGFAGAFTLEIRLIPSILPYRLTAIELEALTG